MNRRNFVKNMFLAPFAVKLGIKKESGDTLKLYINKGTETKPELEYVCDCVDSLNLNINTIETTCRGDDTRSFMVEK